MRYNFEFTCPVCQTKRGFGAVFEPHIQGAITELAVTYNEHWKSSHPDHNKPPKMTLQMYGGEHRDLG